MKIALTGGGTGGHIYPCFAVAEALSSLFEQERLSCSKLSASEESDLNKSLDLFYIGGEGKLEERLVKEKYSQIKFLPVEASRLPRTLNPLRVLSWLVEFISSIFEALKYLEENKIDVVFGTGGYVSAPAFAAAVLRGTPYIIHNLDAYIGLANRVFIRDAAAISLAFPLKTTYPISGRLIIPGNPVSKEFFSSNGVDPSKKINLLVTGGSQGARSINNFLGEILPELVQIPNLEIVHVTGAKEYDSHVQNYLLGNPNLYPNYKVISYTHDMPKLCKEADVAICRSGAMTIAEMAASETVPIFIPLPWAANNHQYLNAKALAEGGAAILLNQKELEKNGLGPLKSSVIALLTGSSFENKSLESMRVRLSEFANPGSAVEIAEAILSLS